MPIYHWPSTDQPREKLFRLGEAILTDAELLAILIQSGTRNQSALDLAKEWLIEHGGLKQLCHAADHLLTQKPGIGRAKLALLRAAVELGNRLHQHSALTAGDIIQNPHAACTFLLEKMRAYANEVFACLFLDTHFRLIKYEEIFHGTVNEATVYPRELIRRGIRYNAAKIILVHNHPSGITHPSQSDQDITKTIRDTLAAVDIKVVDHIIVGHVDCFSFAEKGLLTL